MKEKIPQIIRLDDAPVRLWFWIALEGPPGPGIRSFIHYARRENWDCGDLEHGECIVVGSEFKLWHCRPDVSVVLDAGHDETFAAKAIALLEHHLRRAG